jgi:enamine deaminase RidA (YjgF/YER057c/UK114 family)
VNDYETTADLGDVGPTQRLAVLGIEVPEAPAPAASYVGHVAMGGWLQTAGQIALAGGELLATGRVGDTVDLPTAQACARQCAVNVLAQIRAAGHALEDVRRVIKLTVYVASAPDFTEQHLVANGASDLFGDVFGEAGRHARSAVGVAALPLNSPVEVDALVELGAAAQP